MPSWLKQTSTIPHVDRTSNWTDRTVFHNRLLRGGWQPQADAAGERWERRHSRQPLTLVFTELGWDAHAFGGPHVVGYALRGGNGEVVALPDVTWADFDQHGRLVMAQAGKLLLWQSQDTWVTLADFSAQVPDSAAAPGWALNWPRRRA